MARTLRSRGFSLPKTPPEIGHRGADGNLIWNAHALRTVVRDFLRPDLSGRPVAGGRRGDAGKATDAIINQAAAEDGHDHRPYGYTVMARDFTSARTDRASAERIACWLGYSVEEIWPDRWGYPRTSELIQRIAVPLPFFVRVKLAAKIIWSGRH